MKQDNRDIFDIDFNTKKNTPPKKTSNSDFFDLSMSDNKILSDETDFFEELNETEIAEESPIVVEDFSPSQDETPVVEEAPVVEETTAVDETPVEEEASDVEETPVVEEPPVAEIPSPAITSVPVEDTAKIEDDSVTITKVNWHKKAQTNAPLYNRTNVSPTSVPSSSPTKKKSLVIDTDDGFEIKICDFRGLANK